MFRDGGPRAYMTASNLSAGSSIIAQTSKNGAASLGNFCKISAVATPENVSPQIVSTIALQEVVQQSLSAVAIEFLDGM